VDSAEQIREEEHFRQVERAMLYAEDAARKMAAIASDLEKDGAPEHLVTALTTAAESIRDEHRRLMKSVYWRAPS